MSTKNTVLIVEDNPADVYICKYFLNRSNCIDQIYEVSDGREAWHLFDNFPPKRDIHPEEFPPTVILLDINMPMMNGFDFLDKLVEKGWDQNKYPVVVIMLTSSDQSSDRERAMSYPMVKDYLVKPLSQESAEKICHMIA